MKSFQGKVAVITGAGFGIGRALAVALAREGARLAISDIHPQALDETLRLLPKSVEARGYVLDVTQPESVLAHAEAVCRDFGTAHLLFNNAGTSMIGLFENQTLDEMRWLLDINLWGVIYGTKAFLPAMLAQREGCIVNVSSVFGLVGFASQSTYNIAKFGVRGLTEALWQELDGSGVEAVCVHPGGIKSGLDSRARFCAAAGAREHKMLDAMVGTMHTTPEACAAAILAGIKKGKRRIVTGHLSGLLHWVSRLFPDRYPVLLKPFLR